MIKKQAEADISTELGIWRISAYAADSDTYAPHLALSHEPIDGKNEEPVLVRIHSECITGDLFGSTRCDCGEQLERAMELMSKQGGVIIYLRQEGRGIGLINKLKAYNLQDKGADTIDANVMLGHEADERTYEIAREILKDLGIKKIDLLTNNPDKVDAFRSDEIELRSRVPLVIRPRLENEKYLKTKERLMGHLFGS